MKNEQGQNEDRLRQLQKTLREKVTLVHELEAQLATQATEISRLERELSKANTAIDSLSQSFSWKITAPLRFLFDWTVAFPRHVMQKRWGVGSPGNKASTDTESPRLSESTSRTFSRLIDEERSARRRVGRSEKKPPWPGQVRLIAFYLPQFHPIPENDRWWGKGFTEWNNVKKAKPLFKGHYQPRIPGELGYYDLRDVEVQRKQVELAKLYGLGGFCFYFYWFNGKRLLERPLLQYLENTDLDFPFCLCWANENWTRTWDGKDDQVLIGQEHSDEDDLAFIQYLAKYLEDERYIHVKGKPLILVYRPSLLPDPAKTAQTWRTWCRENGLGEIYLAYTQSFEKPDPSDIGFDAAIEFPPNNTKPDNITDQVKDLPFKYKGNVYDWTSIADRSENYTRPAYTLFRGVNPSWDNTARRKSEGSVFVGNTPERYQRWLENAIRDTKNRFVDTSESMVFINAWNEWAEGAYMEPDQRLGYSNLRAASRALEKMSISRSPK